MIRLHYLSPARADLRHIITYIGRENPRAARIVRDEIDRRASQLIDHPESAPAGRLVGTRELVVGRYPYTLVYRVRGDRVEVLRILHEAQRWPPE
ncbi:MAG TPA: type II toxin-antitoxin system RelE/ParE family toxin [Gammaproteobacteria bacterium]|nr:type II toxin-antitoxin system RelE/ParE family toxin [Gammaproteobacteria bacterium]